MKRFLAVAALGCAVMGTGALSGQDLRPKTRPVAVAQPPGAKPVPTIDELSIPGNAVTVGKFLPMVKQKLPSFQYVAKEGHWQDFVLPSLSLQDVTASQVVELLSNMIPHFQAVIVSGAGSTTPLWLFSDRPVTPATGTEMRLVAFGLNDPIDRLALRKSWSITAFNEIAPTPEEVATSRKAALKEVLSLLESAISQSPESGTAPSLKLHEETGVLLVKGTSGQINAITQALEALKSGDDPNQLRAKYNRLTSEYESIKSKNNLLQTRNTSLESRNNSVESTYVQYVEKIRSLQRELDALKARGGTPATLPGNSNATEKH